MHYWNDSESELVRIKGRENDIVEQGARLGRLWHPVFIGLTLTFSLCADEFANLKTDFQEGLVGKLCGSAVLGEVGTEPLP